MSLHTATLLLGSNLNNREKNLEEAKRRLESYAMTIIKETKVIETDPVEFVSPYKFLNFALEIQTSLSPVSLLKTLKKIEREIGRTLDSKATGKVTDRLIDLDIVSYDNLEFKSPTLELPHLRHLTEREFSMQLLEELKAMV